MRIIEINGIKLEVDERTARTIESYRVGDKLKVLVKGYSDTYTIYHGVIVGFADFSALPTIEIMYIDGDRWASDVFKFVSLNANTKGVEICPLNEAEAVLDKDAIIKKLDDAIKTKEREAEDIRAKRDYFVARFAQAFEQIERKSAA